MGDRPRALARLVESIEAEPFSERLLVFNGCAATTVEGWTAHSSPVNLGVAGGRHLGMELTTAEFVVFVDDDAWLATAGLVDCAQQFFDTNPQLGAIGYLVTAADGTDVARWIPKRGAEIAPGLRGAVTFPGGAHALRRQAYAAAGGYTPEFFFKHEETDLTWAMMAAGWDVAHTDRAMFHHPPTAEQRHSAVLEQSIRNKLWLVRGRLPRALIPVAAAVALVRHLGMCRTIADIGLVAAGLRAGFGTAPIRRTSMTWRSVAELTRRGRPPVL